MTNADRPYNNPATREDKAEALRNEQRLKRAGDREPTTLHQLSRLGQDEEPAGRFAEARYVTGQEPRTNYPRLPESSPWSGDPVPPEEPLGVAIDAMEPCGEAFEIERSIAEQELGEPTDAATPGKSLPSVKRSLGNARVGSPPHSNNLVEAVGSDSTANAVVKSQVVNSPACDETCLDQTPPPDGLDDVPRRQDGWPLSSHAIKPRRK